MDRLAEIRRGGGGGGRRGRGDDDDEDKPQKGSEIEMDEKKPASSKAGGLSQSISGHMKQYDEIKEGLVKIRNATTAIERLKEKEQKSVNERERKENMAELDTIMTDVSNVAGRIKAKLDVIKADNDKFSSEKVNQHSATTQMRANMYSTHVRRFHQEMQVYNQAANDFRTILKDRTRRQLPILIKDITPEKVEEIIDKGQAEEVISQALISEDLDNVIAQIEERHQGIMKLERQVLEVHQLFRDLATLVDLQQETMDVISERIDRAKDYTVAAEKELIEARAAQRRAAKRQCCILVLVLCILAAILAPILFTKIGHI